MDNIGYTYLSKKDYQPSGNLQEDLYQIIKLELGYYFDDLYEESLDAYALASSMAELNYFENESQVIRRVKTPLKDKKIANLQDYITSKRSNLKDGFSSPKDRNQLSTALDILDKCNKNILQLVFNICQEIKEGILKRANNDGYQLIDLYYSKHLSKKFGSFAEYIDNCQEYLAKTINLVYGGRNYGKKH
ncbi:MAG: hypothetical protein E7361_00115 [Clostridiales bacterium]|nr:hypothetical protein [Clostridiales bacterium]